MLMQRVIGKRKEMILVPGKKSILLLLPLKKKVSKRGSRGKEARVKYNARRTLRLFFKDGRERILSSSTGTVLQNATRRSGLNLTRFLQSVGETERGEILQNFHPVKNETVKRRTDVVLFSIIESLFTFYLLSLHRNVVNINNGEIQDFCNEVNRLMKIDNLPLYLKEQSHLCRKFVFEDCGVIDRFFSMDPLLASYIGRSLGPTEVDKRHKQIQDYMSTFKDEIVIDKKSFVNYRVSSILQGFCKGYSKREFIIPSSDASCLFNTRKKGGQAKMLQDLCRIYDVKTYHDFLGMCYDLEDEFLNHIDCKGCDKPELHYPFGVTAVPEAGYKNRVLGITSPLLIACTSNLQNHCLGWMKKNPICGPMLRGEDIVLPEGGEFYYSVDFSKATDNFSADLLESIKNGFLSEVKNSIEQKYIRASFSMGRIFPYGSQQKKWIPLEELLKEVPDIPLTEDYIMDNKQFRLMVGHGYPIDKNFLSGTPRIDDLFYPTYTDGVGIGNDMKTTSSIFRQVYVEHEKIRINRDYLKNRVRHLYKEMFKSTYGFIQKKGQHMGLPLSFVSLTAVNLALVGFKNALTMGDDCVIVGSMKDIENYNLNAEEIGLVLNKDKSYISKTYAVFCEKIFVDGIEQEDRRIKTILQPNKDWIHNVESVSKDVGMLRISKNFNEFSILLSYGWDPSMPAIMGGFGWDKPYFNYSSFEPEREYKIICRNLKLFGKLNGFKQVNPILQSSFVQFTEKGYTIQSVLNKYFKLYERTRRIFRLNEKELDPYNIGFDFHLNIKDYIYTLRSGPLMIYSEDIKNMMEL